MIISILCYNIISICSQDECGICHINPDFTTDCRKLLSIGNKDERSIGKIFKKCENRYIPEIRLYKGRTQLVSDGASLSYMGIPCPNLCTGGHNYPGRFGYYCLESMGDIVKLLIKLTEEEY